MAEQYQIPQFIEMEAKIIGPLSLKQFGYVAAPLVLGLILSAFLKLYMVFIITLPFLILGVALAFLKIGGISFPRYLKGMLKFSFNNKVYIFKNSGQELKVFNLKKLEEIEKILNKEDKSKFSLERLASLIQVGVKKDE